jgi:hypothetical protein
MLLHTCAADNACSRVFTRITAPGADKKEFRMLVDKPRRPARPDVRIVVLSVAATAMLIGAALTSWVLR